MEGGDRLGRRLEFEWEGEQLRRRLEFELEWMGQGIFWPRPSLRDGPRANNPPKKTRSWPEPEADRPEMAHRQSHGDEQSSFIFFHRWLGFLFVGDGGKTARAET